MAFAHLHVHTEYSLLDGSNKIKEYVARVKELGMDSAAITDHGVMYGVIDFYRAAREAGIKPILGCEVYVAPNSRFDKELTGGEERYHHLVLLAENNTGYANLMKIVSRGFTEGYYYKPRVDMEVLQEFHEGIIALSACLAGEVPRFILKGMKDEARKAARKYEACFGKGNYFLELQDHGIPEQRTVNMELLQMSRELDIPLVTTNDVHYTYAEDAIPHDILLCLQTGKKLADEDRMRYEGGQYYVKSEEEMKGLFPYAWEAVENTQRIADRCNVEIEFGVTKLPKYDVPEGYDSWSYLNKLCDDGLAERYGDGNQPAGETGQTLRERLDYELGVIQRMGYVDYFLIVWDFINYAKEHGIPVGPGRGSAAGSIVAYCLKITNIDPIHYNLLFERFLNPERVSMPDIDVDFCFERRQEVIDYVGRKYGNDKVVQIVTFGTLAAKGVIRDVGRVMDLPYAFVDSIAKMVPNELNITLSRALEMNPEFRKLYQEDEQVRHLIDMCKRLEGLPRHTSMHAAGVVICQKSADEFVPLSRGSDGSIVTQFTMTTLEELGLLKMDFLGLRTLTVIHDAVQFIENTTGRHIDVDAIDYNDPKVLASIGTGRTEGVFQLESAGMKSFMKELRPQNLEDVVAGISLYRPGPMDFIPKYIQGKNHPDAVTYACPQLEPILEPTYGCIVYQEQVMQICRKLAGYSYGRADLVRRAMAKKKADVMEKERSVFIDGAVKNGVSAETAEDIFNEMSGFASYAFNKSHAAAYAHVAYQTAYLKCHYYKKYMAQVMTNEFASQGKLIDDIALCEKNGVKILCPDINRSGAGFTADENGIRFGLLAVRNLGRTAIDNIIEERRKGGTFRSLDEFCRRMSGKDVNRKAVESLIKCGAFDSFALNRREMMENYDRIFIALQTDVRNNIEGQMSFFDSVGGDDAPSMIDNLHRTEEYPLKTLLMYEKEAVGMYISGHPLDEFRFISAAAKHNTIHSFFSEDHPKDGAPVQLICMITSVKQHNTKKGAQMAFSTVEDNGGECEVIFFPEVYAQSVQLIRADNIVFLKGKLSYKDDEPKILAEMVIPAAQYAELAAKSSLFIRCMSTDKEKITRAAELCRNYKGSGKLNFYFEDMKKYVRPKSADGVNVTEELLEKLAETVGAANVAIKF